jgi:peptidoglycan-associated lipoprotein
MRFLKFAFLALALGLLATGCSSTGKAKGEGEDGLDPAGAGGPQIGKYGDGSGSAYGAGANGAGLAGGQYGGGSPDDATGPLSKRIVYFQYDSSDVLPEYLPVVNSHAGYLAAHPGKGLVLEGHADERGSPEYNIALGEQRAKAVAKLMKLQGVKDSQLQIVSFGEEKPQALGHDDAAWQQNRRVEIYYPGR